MWFYPNESYPGTQTGIAQVDPPRHAPLTGDGEAYDPGVMAAAHQTLPLPAIARLTDLDNGRQVTLRINDRGPPNPARLISVTPRVAELLGMNGAARVRLEVLREETQAAVDEVGGRPKLALAAAPVESVQAVDLPSPGQASASPAKTVPGPGSSDLVKPARPLPVTRLPEQVLQGAPEPGRIMLLLGAFTNAGPARLQASSVSGLAPTIVTERAGRSVTYTVVAGPYETIPEADAALERAIRAGVNGARLVIEEQTAQAAD